MDCAIILFFLKLYLIGHVLQVEKIRNLHNNVIIHHVNKRINNKSVLTL